MLDLLFQSLTTYYGLDWVSVFSGISATYALGKQNRIGFIFSAISCVSGVAVASISGQYGYVCYNFVLMIMAVRAYANWAKAQTTP